MSRPPCSQRLLSRRMLSRVVLALLLIDPAASLVLPVSSPVSHGVRRAPAPVAFDLKKMCAPQFARASAILSSCAMAVSLYNPPRIPPTRRRFDPEGAMERGVRQDELAGGDGSKASLARTKAKAKAAADKPMEMPKIDLPKFELPNPFGDKK